MRLGKSYTIVWGLFCIGFAAVVSMLDNLIQAVNILGVVEEAARDAITAMAIGGPVEIEPEMREAALQRAVAFGVVPER